MIKFLPDAAAGRDKLGWQTEYRKSKGISNESIKPQKMVTRFLALQEKKSCMNYITRKYLITKNPVSKLTTNTIWYKQEAALTIKRFY